MLSGAAPTLVGRPNTTCSSTRKPPALKMRLLAAVTASVAAAATVAAAPTKARYNVLFFAVDDLRYQL